LFALSVAFGLPFANEARGATLLFSSGFENATNLGTPYGCWGPASGGCWQDIAGTDGTTGYSWPPSLWGGGGSVQLLADASVDATTVRNYMFNQLVTVAGHTGAQTKALYSQVTQSGCCGQNPQGSGATQSVFQLRPAFEGGDLYVSYWVRFQSDLAQQLAPQNWRYLFSWKTGTPGGANDGDYRVEVNVVTWGNVPPYWLVRGDNAAGSLPYSEFWRVENNTAPVPVGQWFKFEIFWHRSTLNDGRVAVAVNGQVICDRYGPNIGANSAPINRIMIGAVYGGGPYPMYQWVDDLQIWDGIPF
jgi:hypothetical protein